MKEMEAKMKELQGLVDQVKGLQQEQQSALARMFIASATSMSPRVRPPGT
jgi:hypothetical protein